MPNQFIPHFDSTTKAVGWFEKNPSPPSTNQPDIVADWSYVYRLEPIERELADLGMRRVPAPPSANRPDIIPDYEGSPYTREPVKTKPPRAYGGPAPVSLRDRLFWLFVVLAIGVAIALMAYRVATDTDTQCARSHNGYPLVSFQVDGSGDEINCRYGVNEVPQ